MCCVVATISEASTVARMSPALNGSSEIQHFEHNDMIKIRDRIMLVFYRDCHVKITELTSLLLTSDDEQVRSL